MLLHFYEFRVQIYGSRAAYTLTLVVTNPQADKKRQAVARSMDFTVIN